MIACVDVDYRDDGAVAACVLFAGWADETPAGEHVARVSEVAPYEPGQFYKRELPCLLAVLGPALEAGGLEAVVVDGYVWLHDEHTPGLVAFQRPGSRPLDPGAAAAIAESPTAQ